MKRNTFVIDLGPTQEASLLLENLDEYVKLLGFSRKRFYLMAAATLIAQEGDNTKLIHQVADYLSGVGSKLGRPRSKEQNE